ncbi:MAG: DUF1488 domain-containing protein [Aestuariivirgaceae bacterium]|jgi:hypothetical protein|nr:DUF1488 domain-containing protein [Aestuariivirgaceae bacterium]
MRALAFLDESRHFDGGCVRFYGHDGERRVACGITASALKEHDAFLPHHGLLPAELFLEAFDRHQIAIHDAARRKYACGDCETEGDVLILLHRRDLG